MARQRPANLSARITALLGSRGFFAGVVAVLVLQAAWIALSGRYPMAFDEDFHLGIIRLYSHHVSPFWSSHPAGADAFGAVSRDPSYLYQYLMSFPYRLISLLTHNQSAQVVMLRAINIGLFAAGLPLYRRLLLKTGASRAAVHFCIAVFVLVPIVPLLAAQINYDNLLLPLTALSLLLAVNIGEELRRYQRIDMKSSLGLVAVCLAASLVKYAFLPIFAIIAGFVVVELWRAYAGNARKFWMSVGFGFSVLSRRVRLALLILLVVLAGLFAQRYGVNVVRYHKPVPECTEVLSVKQCAAYPPWNRDYWLSQAKKDAGGTDSPLTFSADWFYGMWLRTFFAVDGPATNFQTRGPLLIPGIGAIIFASAALAASVVSLGRMWKRYDHRVLGLFIAVTAGYASVLWLDEYRSFLQTGAAVAINGRYLLPVAPMLLLLLVLGTNELLRGKQAVKAALASSLIVCMLWGGGALTYILRSNDVWYWHNQAVYDANHAVQHVIGPVTPGYRHLTEFMGRN